MKRLATALLLFCIAPFPALFGQEEAAEQEPRSAKNFFSHIFEDQKEIWSGPFKKDTWKQPQTYFFIGLSAASFSLDGEPSTRLRENGDFDCFNRFFASDTSDIVLAVLPLGLAAAGELSGNRAFKEYGWKAGEAAVNAFIVSSLLKAVTQRSRPHKGDTYGFWEGGNSFPSAHSTYAWALAAVTAKHFSEKKWVSWIVYPVAGMVAFSRITSGNHYFSDAVTGSALGFVIGHYVVK